MATKSIGEITAELVKKGKEVGFVTQDEVLTVFPDAESKVQELDDLYTHLAEEGIDVLEVGTEEVWKQDSQSGRVREPRPNLVISNK